MSHTELLSLIQNDMELELMTNNKTCEEDKLESEINSEIQQNHTHQVNNSDEKTPPSPTLICNGTGDFTHQVNGGDDDTLPLPCDGTGSWRRAVYLDITDSNTNCPEGWNMTDYSKRTCGRATDGRLICDSSVTRSTFSVSGGEYSQEESELINGDRHLGSEGHVLLGLLHWCGCNACSPRQHIWSFVAGVAENYPKISTFLCPCDGFRSEYKTIPTFVGEDC